MSLKRRGSELDREAKKMKSDDRNGDDEVTFSSWVQATQASPHQTVTDLADLPQTVREQVNYLLQALSDISPETPYKVNIFDQINAINSHCDSPPELTFKPPEIEIMVGHKHRGDSTHDCEDPACDKYFAKAKAIPYADGYRYFSVEVVELRNYTGGRYWLPCTEWEHGRSTFEEKPWKENYLRQIRSLVGKVAVSHNRKVLGWWVRKITHAETPFEPFRGREQAREEFLSGYVSWTGASRNAWYFR
ncbi:hypothetical protein FGLOB1_4940 [Fusarium globosum]|uniref:Uncharacterized protein n=1 Tax=Fusarium globosum TaxID=78864 RepID=A0A8H6DBM0_9HYPO|nr:hypothetical protein FGLOB1_4940 [Fusarium globosum]